MCAVGACAGLAYLFSSIAIKSRQGHFCDDRRDPDRKIDSPIFAEEEKEEETEGQVSPQEECGLMKLDRDEIKSGNWKIVF